MGRPPRPASNELWAKGIRSLDDGTASAFADGASPSMAAWAMRAFTPAARRLVVISDHQQLDIPTYHLRLQANAGSAYRRELPKTVVSALQRGDRKVIIDCEAWLQLDLILLSALVNCAKVCCDRGAQFELENLGGEMRAKIEALGLAQRLQLHS
jgi:hypothetical protein